MIRSTSFTIELFENCEPVVHCKARRAHAIEHRRAEIRTCKLVLHHFHYQRRSTIQLCGGGSQETTPIPRDLGHHILGIAAKTYEMSPVFATDRFFFRNLATWWLLLSLSTAALGKDAMPLPVSMPCRKLCASSTTIRRSSFSRCTGLGTTRESGVRSSGPRRQRFWQSTYETGQSASSKASLKGVSTLRDLDNSTRY